MELLEYALAVFVLLPLVGFILSGLMPQTWENSISRIAFGTAGLQLHLVLVTIAYWAWLGFPVVNIKEFVIYDTESYEFFLDFYFDRITVVYLFVGALLTFMITVYSRYYLHREPGFKRFFYTILFFFLGYNLTILAGNFETLFIGWEILGLSSFLLIAFYRDRYLPVRNAVKVFSIYRLGDVGLILAMWMSHHLWHENITFLELNNYIRVDDQIQNHFSAAIFVSLMIFVAAIAKSAQFPFSSWLPRAMEGPTPSSAIFYSSLSVHIGVFLLLRTFHFWEHQIFMRVLIGSVGLVSAILASFSSRVQSSVKSQIAYSSVSQIGLIFIEISLGLELLALIHFAGNAFLRSYQLLVSPSVVTYLIREQFYEFVPAKRIARNKHIQKLRNSIYTLSLREWSLDSFMFSYLWQPIKRVGNKLQVLNNSSTLVVIIFILTIGSIGRFLNWEAPHNELHLLPIFFASIGLIITLASFSTRVKPMNVLIIAVLNHFFIDLAVSFNEYFSAEHSFIYLGGVLCAAIPGFAVLAYLKKQKQEIDLQNFYGYVWQYPKASFIFLGSIAGLSGFPITSAFLGEDLIYSHVHEQQFVLMLLISLSFIVAGLSLIRIYSRLFLGPNKDNYQNHSLRTS